MFPNNVTVLCICLGMLAAVLTFAVCIACYMACCIRWRRRIAEVREGQTVYFGWNLKKLKETVRELEYDKVSRMELLFR